MTRFLKRPQNLLEAIEMPDATPALARHPFAIQLATWHHAANRRERLATLDTWRADHAASMKEDKGSDSVQAHLLKYVKAYKLPFAYHTYRSDMSEAGYPDWALVGHPGRGMGHAELKAESGKFSTAQINCMVSMRMAGVLVVALSPVDVFNGRMEAFVASLAQKSRS